ncbi:MAG: hypothetical protein AAGJ46_09420 [Planctomycetota bacterium]
MLRFNVPDGRRPRNYLLRSEQTKLLSLVSMAALVVLAASQVRSPEGVRLLAAFLSQPAAVAGGVAFVHAEMTGPAKLPAERFADVADNTYFRVDEQAAWFETLAELRDRGGPAEAEPVTYALLVNQPDRYRGVGVVVSGSARIVEAVKPAENDLGIERLYRVTVQPAGGEVWPITLYCLAAPEGVAVGEPIQLPVEARGYFFKNASYRWQDGVGVTPAVLCQSLATVAPAVVRQQVAKPVDPWFVLAAALLLSLSMIGLFVAVGPKRRKPRMLASEPPREETP